MSTAAPTIRHARFRPAMPAHVPILMIASGLTLVGLMMVLSAASVISVRSGSSAFEPFIRQSIFAAMGMLGMFLLARLDYRRLRGVGYILMPACWVLLILVLIPGIGIEGYGSRRWLPLGFGTLQPSEVAKLVLIIFGADVLVRKRALLGEPKHVLVPFGAAIAITCLLVLIQPDFGTTIIIGACGFIVAFAAGVKAKFLLTTVGVGLVLGLPTMLAAPYRRARFFGFLFGADSPLGAGYQAAQGLIALGSGGFFGLGLGSSRQKYLYLPNADTDFIFAILGEETGLLGALVVITAFAVLAVVGIRAARMASDDFGFVLAVSITGWITLQALINIGAVVGVLPITGVTLPFVSAGGSSLVVTLFSVGILASIARRSRAASTSPRSAQARRSS